MIITNTLNKRGVEPDWFSLTSIDGTINITPSPNWNATIKEYSLDEGENWNLWDETSIITGTSIKLRGKIGSSVSGVDSPWIINGTNVYCSGNIETLLDYESVLSGKPPRHITKNAYASMFQGCTALITPPKLPTTVIDTGCYYSMFKGCVNLIRAPELPSTVLTYMCYYEMFEDCTSLTVAPKLPAKIMESNCYGCMFYGCSSLIATPELPARKLATGCYERMFYGCSSIINLPKLPATTLTDTCYLNMFEGCLRIKVSESQIEDYQTPYRIPSVGEGTSALKSLDNMFRFTSGLFTGTPTVNTTYYTANMAVNYLTFTSPTGVRITPSSYWNATAKQYSLNEGRTWINWTSGATPSSKLIMFRGLQATSASSTEDLSNSEAWLIEGTDVSCSGNIETLLDYQSVIKEEHPTMGIGCYHNMFKDQPIEVPPELPSTQLSEYCYDSMFANCISLTTTPNLPATVLADSCYANMFSGCTELATSPELPADTLADNCYSGMFIGCTSLTAVNDLPAKVLSPNCYSGMFIGCKSLMRAPKLSATTLANNCYYVMFADCLSLNISKGSGSVEFLNCTNIPISSKYASNMFYDTIGEFMDTPKRGERYYYNVGEEESPDKS